MELEALSPFLEKYGLDVVGVVVASKLAQYVTNFLKRPLRVIFKVEDLGRWSLLVVLAGSGIAGFTLYQGITGLIVSAIIAGIAIGAHETANGG